MKAIPTVVPGLSICDHLPHMAAVMDKVTVVRSVTHPYPLHCVAYTTSGIPEYDVSLETARATRGTGRTSARLSITSIGVATAGALPDLPQNVGLPWLLNSKSDIRRWPAPTPPFWDRRTIRSGPCTPAKGRRSVPN